MCILFIDWIHNFVGAEALAFQPCDNTVIYNICIPSLSLSWQYYSFLNLPCDIHEPITLYLVLLNISNLYTIHTNLSSLHVVHIDVQILLLFGIWVILWKWELNCDIKTKSENLSNNNQKHHNNIRVQIPMKVCMLFMCKS